MNLFLEKLESAATNSFDIPLFIEIRQFPSSNEELIIKRKFAKAGWDMYCYMVDAKGAATYVFRERSWKNFFTDKRKIK